MATRSEFYTLLQINNYNSYVYLPRMIVGYHQRNPMLKDRGD